MPCMIHTIPFFFNIFTILHTYQYIFYLYNYKIISKCRVVVPLNSLEHTFRSIHLFYPLRGNYLPKSILH